MKLKVVYVCVRLSKLIKFILLVGSTCALVGSFSLSRGSPIRDTLASDPEAYTILNWGTRCVHYIGVYISLYGFGGGYPLFLYPFYSISSRFVSFRFSSLLSSSQPRVTLRVRFICKWKAVSGYCSLCPLAWLTTWISWKPLFHRFVWFT